MGKTISDHLAADVGNFISPSEAARRAGVSIETIRAHMRSGKLGYTKTALGRLIAPAAVDRLIESRAAGLAK